MDSVAIVMSAAGGLALFLYGLRLLSSALKRAIGEKMRALLERLTGKAYRGVIVGAVTSGILQSSSMTMVLLIGLLNAGALKLSQGIGVMLGSEIGTTLTAQIIAFKIGHYYLPIITIGFLMSEIFRGKKAGDVGRIVLGFGLLFLGMGILSGGLKGLAQSAAVLGLLESCGSNILLGVLVGAVVTAIIQSSSAMTALVIALGAAGVLTLPAAIALTLGANIGTTITAQIASIGSSVSSRRLAMAQLLVNVLGVAVFLPFVSWFARMMALTSASLPRQIANAHTVFNVAVTLALIPCVGTLVWLVERIVRGREATATAAPQFLADEFLSTPSVALSQARHELLRMADMADSMIGACHTGVMERSRSTIDEVFETEEAVDGLKRAIEDYLDRIHGDSLSEKEERRLHVLHHVTGDIERVGDQAVNIAQRGLLLLRDENNLSETARSDLNDLFEKTMALYRRSIESLREEDRDLARQALGLEEDVDRLEREYKTNHVIRLERGDCNSAAGILYVEILHNLERMGDHAVNIAGDVLHAI
ncbi:MAG: Na/Pi cotransporter family protein [Candidatus Atribacteria bacterium]|nr:MAG: Na/Pi cotransporter family protein [Candidatus Atribacteria bacterium]